MSTIVKFFVASPSDAADSLNCGPNGSLRTVESGNFDVEEALLDWEAHLTGSALEELVDREVPEVFAESEEEGPIVFLLSDALLESFSSSSSFQVGELAKWWVEKKSQDGFPIDLFIASEILQDLVHLIHEERLPGENVYCWTS
ncbi:hypothetical protein ACFQ9J_11055 [Streptomyces sp. NPDC056529]|uniref:hypothetical protein n=1 Tax=Streptomyces sp. NPDC056529 TaxID=3345855 RepID=UPI00369BF28D